MARALPFALYIGLMAASPWLSTLLQGVDSRWLYGLRVGVVLGALLLFSRHYGELSKQPAATPRDWLISLAVGFVVFILWINLDLPGLSFPAGEGFDPRGDDGGIRWGLAAMRVVGAALIVPVMEELFWRSFILRWIDQADFLAFDVTRAGLRGLALSSLLFGFEHGLWFAGILAGLAYGWLYRRSGNLWMPIVAHGLTNFLLGAWVLISGQWYFW